MWVSNRERKIFKGQGTNGSFSQCQIRNFLLVITKVYYNAIKDKKKISLSLVVVLGSIFIEKFLALLSLKFTPMKSTLVVVENCEIRPEYISPREENE